MHAIPCTLDGRARHNVQNAMFAAAIAFAMGVEMEDIRQGLRTFDTTFDQAPGRMNVYDRHPFKVIMDYGHNASAVRSMSELADRMDVRGKRTVVLAAPGDRRDEDVVDIARAAAGHFDRYVCRRDDGLRGRKGDEIPKMLRAALLEAGVSPQAIEVVPDEQEAIDVALRRGKPGDLVLIFADALTRSWEQIVRFRPEDPGPATAEAAAIPAFVDGRAGDVPLDEGQLLIRDERGVRLARETEVTD
jgi:cyanophycin synthetase